MDSLIENKVLDLDYCKTKTNFRDVTIYIICIEHIYSEFWSSLFDHRSTPIRCYNIKSDKCQKVEVERFIYALKAESFICI